MDSKDIETINKIDEYVTNLNSKVKHPYFFSWSLPTNHVAGNPVSYFCIWIGKYLGQGTISQVERSQPILFTYFFGRINNLNDANIPENIGSWWAERFSEMLKKYYISIEAIARGYKDANYSEYNTHEFSEEKKLEIDRILEGGVDGTLR